MVGGQLLGGVDGSVELPLRLDDVVGRQHDQGGGRVGAGDQGRPQADARGRVPPLRLADDLARRQFGQLGLTASAAWAAPVTTQVRSGGTRAAMRSSVPWRRVRSPLKVRNCFGRVVRLRGQNRVPPPPAMIIA